MKAGFSACLLLFALCPVFAALDTRVTEQTGGRLSFTFALTDTLLVDSSGPVLKSAQPDGKGSWFYPLLFCLPDKAVITRVTVSENDAPALLVAGEAGLLRGAYVAALKLYPLSGKNNRLTLCRKGKGLVEFTAPAAKTAAPAAPDGDFLSERFLQRLVRNYDLSRSLRASPARPLAKAAASPYAAARIKLFIDGEGVYAITAADLAAQGFDPVAVDPATFRLFSHDREIPVHVQTDMPGRFREGDRILFYGTFEKGSGATWYPEHTFSRAYYLDWGGALGLRAPLENGAPKYLDSLGRIKPFNPLLYSEETRDIRTVSSFRKNVHLEQDKTVLRLSSPDQIRSDANVPVEEYEFGQGDYWMWSGMRLPLSTQEFELDSRPATQGTARVRVNFMGYTKDTKGAHVLSVYVNGVLIRGEQDTLISWSGQAPATFVSASSADHLNCLIGGKNVLSVLHPDGDIVFLNWIEVEYDAQPGLVSGGIQHITLDTSLVRGTACYKLTLPGLTGDPEIWDVQGRRFTDFLKTGGAVSFYDILEKPATYCVSTRVLTPRAFSRKTSADLTAAGLGCDLLIIVPDSLQSAISGFVAHKRTQGLSVYVAPVEAIYDQFGDGSVNPDFIRAFLKYAYAAFSPRPFYLLLIGDTSEGSDKISPRRNLIPTYFVQVNGWGIASADSRFALVSGDDLFPDFSVGRIPGKNREEIQTALKKIMDYERAADPGSWKNDFLLLGGGENSFTVSNDRFQRFVLADKFNVRRVDTDPASAYFYPNRNPEQAFSIMNNGTGFVNFYGHGGGSVWSDGKPDLMGHESARALTNYRNLPVVFSLTCLTASFEAASFGLDTDLWPPLGETMLLSGRGGCAAFYGASGHSFLSSDYFLNMLLLRSACDDSFPRVGDIIFNAEHLLIASYGTPYFPVAGQYNLLGDPTMRISRPGPLSVIARNPVLTTGDTLVLDLATNGIPSGTGVVRIFDNEGNLRFYHPFTLSGSRDTVRVPFKQGQRFPQGIARVFVWDNARDEMGQAPFTISELSFSKVSLFTVNTASGDTFAGTEFALGERVFLEAQVLAPSSGFTLLNVEARWTPDTSFAQEQDSAFPNLIPLSLVSAGDSVTPAVYRSDSGIPLVPDNHLEQSGVAYALTAYFQRQVPETPPPFYTRYYHFNVLPPPDLSFPVSDKISIVIMGRPAARTRFLNYGRTPVHSFSILQAVNDSILGAQPFLKTLAPSARDSLDLPLIGVPDFFKVKTTLDAYGEVLEMNEVNNTATACFGMTGGEMGRTDSVILSPGSGVAVRPFRSGDTFNLCLVMDAIDSLDSAGLPVFSTSTRYPLSLLQAFYRPRNAPALARQDFTILSDNKNGDSLVRITYGYRAFTGTDSAVNPAEALGFYQWDPSIGFWKWMEAAVDTSDSTVSAVTGLNRRLAPGRKQDFRGPDITASINGRLLTYQDYIPLNSPIQLMVRDESAVDSHRVRILLAGGGVLPRSRYSMGYVGTSGNLSITFQPSTAGADSLYVTAVDVNGNASDTAAFGYQLGSTLAVKTFANHPNPFGRKTTFALTITDDADVEIRIYTMAGKMIRRLSLADVVGYQEIPWDGRDDEGRRISNGVYYLKLSVKNRFKSIEQIHKIAKAEGR